MSTYFSLILPVYNVALYLKRCIDSILSQDFEDYEVILVDDGSTDESPRICDEYKKIHPAFQVIHKENGGLSSARNAGLEIATGKYIWWIDSDDWIEKGALGKLYRATCEDAPDIVKFNYYRVNEEKTAVLTNAEPGLYWRTEEIAKLLNKAFHSSGKFSLSAWMHIYRKQFLDNCNACFVSERMVGSEDFLINLSVLPRSSSLCVLPELLYNYEMREGSLTQSYKADLPERYERLYGMLYEEYRRMGLLNQYREGISFFYSWHLIRGTCMGYEYQPMQGHSIADGRRNVDKMLRSSIFQEALACCNTGILTWKQRIMLIAMKLKIEPFFYYLYVVKPKIVRHKWR